MSYAVLAHGEDGLEPETWDYIDWHEATMGCQLTTGTRTEFTFTWHNTFGCYGLEVFEQPLESFPSGVGEPWRPATIIVDCHPRWAALLGREIIGTEIMWHEVNPAETLPLWVRLDFAPADQDRPGSDSAWFLGGADDVMVVFDRAAAGRTKMPGLG